MSIQDPKTSLMLVLIASSGLALAGCQRGQEEPPPEPTSPDQEERSIFQPEFQVDTGEPEPAQTPLETRIFFPQGADITEAAAAELATVLKSPQVKDGGEIVLRGHSDAGGSDEVNMQASIDRAEAVRDWMVENGIDEERVRLIGFGEQNPIAPNALPDGAPNEEGRASNRRVDIHVEAHGAAPEPTDEPSLIEALASPEPNAESGADTD